MQAETQDWSEPERLAPLDRVAAEALIVDVAGFEGPLDLLLTLSRTQKVDLRKISVLQLAEQYLEFVNKSLALRLELAADYLVMAAWLAYLKSRLLLPPEPGEDGPSAEELAAHLAYQLERLAAMREAAARLMARDRLGRNFFARGAPESVSHRKSVIWEATLLDLMRAYARIRTRDEFRPFVMDRDNVFTMEQALERLRGLIAYAGDWSDLTSFLPEGWDASPMRRRSSTAAHFAAVLELAKAGKVNLRQGETFAPLLVRRRDPA
jgi:segregation and condensation protein A